MGVPLAWDPAEGGQEGEDCWIEGRLGLNALLSISILIIILVNAVSYGLSK